MEQFEDLNWQEAAVKGRSKSEIYAIMVIKGKYYMPPQSQATSDFIHDIMVGRKLIIFRWFILLRF